MFEFTSISEGNKDVYLTPRLADIVRILQLMIYCAPVDAPSVFV
jgi:hypothetical protein